ncbi:MAG: ABC transporter permease [Clostridia bacterium]|nr:ABC transporter permease [Clostridia bacterium]
MNILRSLKLGQSFSMALKSIKNNKGRSFLTMLGIIIGLAAVITLVTLISGVQKQFMMSFEQMGTNVVQVEYYMDQNRDISREIYDKTLELSELVEAYTPNISTHNQVQHKDKSVQCRIMLGSESYDKCSNYTIERGTMFTYPNIQNADRVAVLGSKTRKDLFDYDNPIGQSIRINGERFTVVGVFEEKTGGGDYMNNIIVVPYTNNRLLRKTPAVTSFIVKATSNEATREVVREMEALMKEISGNDWGYWVYSENQYMEMYNEQTAMLSMAGGGIAGISLIVGGIGIMNIMLVSVTERTREIGIRKSIGARRIDIISQFLIEAGTISLLGGLVGIAVGAFLSLIIGRIMFDNMILLPSLPLVLGAAAFSIFIGMFFGFYPANRASKLHPIEALRAE